MTYQPKPQKPYSVILPAKEIPSGTKVTKGGATVYGLIEKVPLHTYKEGNYKEVRLDPKQVRYLVDEQTFDVYLIQADLPLTVHFDTKGQLSEFIEEIMEEDSRP